MRKKNTGIFVRLVCAAVFLACTLNCSGKDKPQSLEKRVMAIYTESGQAVIEVELARTSAELAQGLMYRKTLEDGRGMLFIFQEDKVQSFWMKNTLIPLSIAFILYDGTIVEIKDMYPHDLSSVHSSRSVRYALETPQGWFGRAGVKPGDRLDIGVRDTGH